MRQRLLGIVLGLCAVSAAQALTPNESVTGAKSETSTPSPTVLVTAQQDKKWRSKGYKPEFRHGVTLYCRHESTLGTHFETNVCRTAPDLEAAERSAQFYLEQNQRIGNPHRCPTCKND